MEGYYTLPLLSGAYVIGTTSTEEKAAKAKACGADEVILYSKKDFVQEVNSLTNGGGVNVVYDGVGRQPLTRVRMIGNYINKKKLSYGYKAFQGFC